MYISVMYIKITTNKQGQSYYHLVEPYRDQGKVRQRTILSLGKVGEDRLDELITAISKHKEILGVMDIAKSLSISDTTILGPLLILQQVFAQFGVDAILKDIVRRHPKLAFDFQRIVFTLVVCRFIRPGSKLRVFDYWQDKLYPGLV